MRMKKIPSRVAAEAGSSGALFKIAWRIQPDTANSAIPSDTVSMRAQLRPGRNVRQTNALWQSTDMESNASPAITNGYVLVTAEDGVLYAFTAAEDK